MKYNIILFLHSLNLYDYIFLGASFIIFLLLLILIVLLRKKTFLSTFLLLFAVIFIVTAPILGYRELDNLLYARTCKLEKAQQLRFSPALLINATLTNHSKKLFHSCSVTANVSKVIHNKFIDELFVFNPFEQMTVTEKNIAPGSTRHIQMILQPFHSKKDFKVTLLSVCR
jgi:hypothetical protein